MKRITALLLIVALLALATISLALAATAKPGDLTSDGTVDVKDMAALYAYLAEGTVPNAGVSSGDINGDASIDILDYQTLYEMILSGLSGDGPGTDLPFIPIS